MKKIIYIILIFSSLTYSARSQNQQKLSNDTTIITNFNHPIQAMPYFIGGVEAYTKFLDSNIHYPAQAIADNVEGRAIVTFVVEKDGHLSNFKLSYDPGYGLGEEAVKVLKLSPKWSPGKANGALVRVQFSVFVKFTLPIVKP